jgi:CRP-like cAMP-binding protein
MIFQNALLSRLTPTAVEQLGEIQIVPLSLRQRLDAPSSAEFVYFVEEGVASVIANADAGMRVELGLIGREGMVGIGIVYDDPQTPYQTIVQVPGNAVQVRAKRLSRLMESDNDVRRMMLRFARAFSIQVASTALANGRAKLEERLARWLLMVADRAGPTFPITHEFISVMLGVRRSGVTAAVQLLESRNLIRATRGSVTLLNRKGLVGTANGSYGFAEAHYERLLGKLATSHELGS